MTDIHLNDTIEIDDAQPEHNNFSSHTAVGGHLPLFVVRDRYSSIFQCFDRSIIPWFLFQPVKRGGRLFDASIGVLQSKRRSRRYFS